MTRGGGGGKRGAPRPPTPASRATAATGAGTAAAIDAGVTTSRWDALDAFRGIALLAMIAYHGAFDLAHFGWLHADFFNDGRLIAARSAILSSFLLASGMSLALAAHGPAGSAWNFWRRITKIGGAATLVSVGSWFVFGDRFIWFGVLHAIAVMSLLAKPLLPLRGWLVAAGVVVAAVGVVVQAPMFDRPALQWIGLMTFKPPTEDYVPIFPWFGAMLVGAGAMSLVLVRPALAARISRWRTGAKGTRWLEWLGRHSLLIYLVHQPILFGTMQLVAAGMRAGAAR